MIPIRHKCPCREVPTVDLVVIAEAKDLTVVGDNNSFDIRCHGSILARLEACSGHPQVPLFIHILPSSAVYSGMCIEIA